MTPSEDRVEHWRYEADKPLTQPVDFAPCGDGREAPPGRFVFSF